MRQSRLPFAFLLALLVSSAHAAVIRVPADQPTVQAGLAAMHGGDTLQVDPGLYDGPLDLGSVPCTPSAPCTLAGAGMFSTTIRGMQAHADWTDLGGGLYRRTMEASIDPIITNAQNAAMRDAFDPGNLYQADAYLPSPVALPEHLPLGYAGDSVTPTQPGQWSYDPATHAITVRPYPGHGIVDVLVPSVSRLASLVTSHGYWTIRDLGLEGSRAFVFDHQPTPAGPLNAMHFLNVSAGYCPQWVARLNPVPGITIQNMRIRWLGRGISNLVPLSQRSAWGLRLFRADGATLTDVDCQHLGSGRGYCGAACEAPWNANTFSTVPYSGHCVDVKQTDTFTIDGATVIDGPIDGNMKIDVSRNGTIRNSFFAENVKALVLNNQTPTPGFTTTCNITVENNLFAVSDAMDFTVQFPTDPSWATCGHIATLDGNLRTDGSPILVEPNPLPPTVTVIPSGSTTTQPATTTTSTTSTSTTATRPPTTQTTTTTSTTTTTCLCPCACPGA